MSIALASYDTFTDGEEIATFPACVVYAVSPVSVITSAINFLAASAIAFAASACAFAIR